MKSPTVVEVRNPPFKPTRLYAILLAGSVFSLAGLPAQAQTAQTASPTTNGIKPIPNETPATVAPVAKAPVTAASPESATTASTTLNTVEVTANRRREPAREVPMQVNTVSTDDLQKAGATKLSDYISSQPGVNFDSQGGTGLGQLSMRGITTGVQTGPTVGVYVDDIPFGSSTFYGGGATTALDMALLDLNHIEILRGPQGTLYGAGAMGGLLKYVTNEPDPGAFSGQVGAGFSATEHGGLNHTEDAVLNIPLKTDVAALRVSAFNDHDGGHTDAIGSQAGSHIDRGDTTGARASLLVTPTNQLTVRLTATTQNINRDGQNLVDYGMNGRPVYGAYTRDLFTAEPFHQNTQLYSAEVEYDFGWARLDSISSYGSINSELTQDATQAYAPIFAAQGLNFSSVSEPAVVNTNKFTQEFRLTSPANQRLEWLTGLFYTHESSTLNQGISAIPQGSSSASSLEQFAVPSTYREYAAYGDLTYHLTPSLAVTGGMRVAHNNQTFEQSLSGLLAGGTTTQAGTSADTSKTYMFTVKYGLTANSNVYARVASGYRPGGPNAREIDPTTGMPILGNSQFTPDTLWSYEAGYKADLFDKRLSLEMTAYEIRWKNVQQLSSQGGVNQVVNAGNAEVKGLEFSSSLRPTNQWNFAVSVALTDAYLTQGSAAAQSSTGDALPDTPRFSAAFSGTYLFHVDGFAASAGAAERFIGMRHAGFASSQSRPDFIMPSYFVTDLQAGIDLKKCTVSFFVRNLFNSHGLLAANTSFVPLGANVLASVIEPRTIGLSVNVPF
jgi:iron complex outermembrane receptor protein